MINDEVKKLYEKYGMKYEIDSRGNIKGDILIVVDNPSLVDIKNNILMSGASSRILFKTLFENGIASNRLYITCARRNYEVLDEKSHKKVIKGDINEYYKTIFEYEVSKLSNVKYVICLGSLASSIYNRQHPISKLRGTFQIRDKECDKLIFYSINPSVIGRDSRLEFMLQRDIEKFSKLHNKKQRTIDQCNFIKDARDVIEFFKWNREISLDIETCGGKISCISMCGDRGNITGLFIDKLLGRCFGEKEKEIISEISKGLQNSKIITQNGMFDIPFLCKQWNIEPLNIYKDTMILHALYYPSYPHSLQYLNSIYGDLEYYKHEKDDWKSTTNLEMLALYNLKDAIITFEVSKCLQNDKIIMDEYNTLVKIASRGIEINYSEAGKTKINIDIEFARALANWEIDAENRKLEKPKNNMKYMKEYIEKSMKLKLQKGKNSLEDKIQALMDWRYISLPDKNLLRSFLFLLKNRGNIKKTKEIITNTNKLWYPYFNITKLGECIRRIFVEDDFSRVKGGHNMFRSYVKNFKARDGFCFIKIKSNLELVRSISKEYGMKSFDAIMNSDDPVEANLRLMFPQIKDVCKEEYYPNGNKTHYWISRKMLEHGNYPINITEIAQRWKITTSELEGVIHLYKKVHPEINEFNKKIIGDLLKNGYIESKSGLKFFIKPDFDENDHVIYLQFMWESIAHEKIMELASNDYTVYVDEDVVVWEVPEEIKEIVLGNFSNNKSFTAEATNGRHTTFSSMTGGKPIHYFEEL